MNPKVKACTLLILVLSLNFCSVAWTGEDDLLWSTYLGGHTHDYGFGVAVDNTGSVFVSGRTSSNSFPTTYGAYDTTYNDPNAFYQDAFVTRLNSSASGLVYSTYLGGTDIDHGWDIAVDASGNAYISGETHSGDFPTTSGAYDTTHDGGYDIFVTKIKSSGADLVYSTLVGGSNTEHGWRIVLDGSGNAYVGGDTYSNDFPITSGAYDTSYNGGSDAFAFKLNSAGNDLSYSTYLGGSSDEEAYNIALDGSGNVYLAGGTSSDDFPTTAGAYDTDYNGGDMDVFVAKLNSSGSELCYSTYIGTDLYDEAGGVGVDGSGSAYVTGCSGSANFPVTHGAFDTTHHGGAYFGDVFVVKLNSTGSDLSYSTFLGGNDEEWGQHIAIDGAGNAYVTGATRSTDFPVSPGAYDTTANGDYDIFVTKLNSSGSALHYSTFLGGTHWDEAYTVALDIAGDAYIGGMTYSSNFPTTSGAFDTTHNGYWDAFAAKFSIGDTTAPEAIDDLAVVLENGSKSDGGDIHLWWTEPADDVAVIRYVIYRSMVAYSLGDSIAGVVDTGYTDVGAAGDLVINYFYTVKAVDAAGNKSSVSNQAGEFDCGLINGE